MNINIPKEKLSSVQNLFSESPTSVSSISLKLYVKQLTGKSIGRYPAEDIPSKSRYGGDNSLAINEDMVRHLIKNTSGQGDISIFPVGPDHQFVGYQAKTLDFILKFNGWTKLENR